MTTQNPYYESIRSAVHREARDLKGQVEERDLEDKDFTEEEAKRAIDDTQQELRNAIYFQQEYCDTPLEVYKSLIHAARDWSHRECTTFGVNREEDVDQLASHLYGAASAQAYDEADKLQWVIEHRLE